MCAWAARSVIARDREAGAQATPSTSSSSDLRRLFQLYRPEKRRLTVAFGALSLSTGITMLVPAGIGRVIDSIATTQGAQPSRSGSGSITLATHDLHAPHCPLRAENLPSVVITLASVFLVRDGGGAAAALLAMTLHRMGAARRWARPPTWLAWR